MIRKAKQTEAEILTALALKSKAYWGYSEADIESWRQDLTVTKQMLENTKVNLFEQNATIAGFYMLNPPENKSIELEMLFVLPKFIGQSIGKKLLIHAINEAKKLKTTTITLLADPNAVPFYKKQGFTIIDKKESSIPNRYLPIMKKEL